MLFKWYSTGFNVWSHIIWGVTYSFQVYVDANEPIDIIRLLNFREQLIKSISIYSFHIQVNVDINDHIDIINIQITLDN
jgi:hypothetical protein